MSTVKTTLEIFYPSQSRSCVGGVGLHALPEQFILIPGSRELPGSTLLNAVVTLRVNAGALFVVAFSLAIFMSQMSSEIQLSGSVWGRAFARTYERYCVC